MVQLYYAFDLLKIWHILLRSKFGKKKIEKIKNLKKSHGSIQYSSKTTSNKEKKYFFQKKKLNIAWQHTIQHTVLKPLYETSFYYTTLGTTILLVYRSVRRKVYCIMRPCDFRWRFSSTEPLCPLNWEYLKNDRRMTT